MIAGLPLTARRPSACAPVCPAPGSLLLLPPILRHALLLLLLLLPLLQEFQSFAASADGAGALAAAGISAEDALPKMRLLAFMGLAHGVTEITFDQIQVGAGASQGGPGARVDRLRCDLLSWAAVQGAASAARPPAWPRPSVAPPAHNQPLPPASSPPLLQSALCLEAGEVEGAVVQATGKKVVEARIDQLRGVVAVSKCAPRTFGAQHWRELQQTLAGWKEAAVMAQQALAEAGAGAPRTSAGLPAAAAPLRA